MDEQKARELVVRAGMELVESGLIARTWGNVSCRLDNERFVITPSGRAYESLKPQDLAVCKIADASYDGDVKPSSEKLVHALVYREKKDVGFVIHTHQKWASAVAACPVKELDGDGRTGKIPVAAYGLPGTKKLLNRVAAVISGASSCALMACHGALCFGADYDAAFFAAHALEENCERFVREKHAGKTGGKGGLYGMPSFSNFPPEPDSSAPVKHAGSSFCEGKSFTLDVDGVKSAYKLNASGLTGEAGWHAAVYLARPDIRFIERSSDYAAAAHADARKPVPAMLDDFAQIAGMSALVAESKGDIRKALRGGRAGVLVPGLGALCCAAERDEARAVKLILEKTALAALAARLFGEPESIPMWECVFMRSVYTRSYSKKK